MADAAPVAPAAAPASAGGGFLAGATVGSGNSQGGGFLSGATVGKQAAPAANAAPAPAPKNPGLLTAPAGGPQLDTSKPLAVPDMSNIGSQFLKANPDVSVPKPSGTAQPADSTPLGIAKNTLEGIPDAAEKVSGEINNTIIQKPADLLSNTNYIKSAAAGLSADPGNVAVPLLQKLSIGLNTLSGVTGGLYKAPNDDTDTGVVDQGLKVLTQGLGMAVGVGALGKVAAAVPAVGAITETLTNLVGRFPLVGKYLAPYIQPLVENAAGFSAYSQLNPDLAGNLKARAETFGTAIGEAPLYTALGALSSAKYSLPASFTLGYGMARLSGASNKDALVAGTSFAFLDAAGRAGGERGNTPEEQQALNDAKLADEAYAILSKYSGVKVTADSSDADVKTAYRKAIHVAHPDAGGTQESGASVNNAYNLVTKGRVAAGDGSKPTEEEQSVSTLRKELQEGISTHGAAATKVAAQENLGIDQPTAERLVRAAQTPNTPEEVQAAAQEFVNSKLAARPDEQVKSDAVAHVASNSDELVKSYIKENGNYVGADEAKELMPGYSQDRSTSDLVQKGASQLAEKVYDHLLEVNQGEGNNTVLISGGGTGSGKSSAIRESGIDPKKYSVVFDSNTANFESAKARIDKALAKNYDVSLVYVHAPVDKAYDRVLDRAEQKAAKPGGGRPVSAQGHIDMHHGGIDTLVKLQEEYKDNPNVSIRIIDNSGTTAKAVEKPVDFARNIADNKGNEIELHKQLNDQRVSARSENRIGDETNGAFARAEKLRPQKEERADRQNSGGDVEKPQQEKAGEGELGRDEKGRFVAAAVKGIEEGNTPNSKPKKAKTPLADSTQKGAVPSPKKVVEDVAQGVKTLKAAIDRHQRVDDVVDQISNSIYKEEGANKVLKVQLTQVVNEARKLSTPAERENVYHYMEDSSTPLTQNERDVVLPLVDEMDRILTNLRAQARAAGIYITGDILDEMTPRNAIEKGGVIDKALDAYKTGKRIITNGGKLTTSVGSGSKHRVYHIITDEEGNRTVVMVKDGKVTALNKGKATELGSTDRVITPKVKEFFDESVMTKLNALAKELGVTHERHATGRVEGLPPSRAGVSYGGADLVKTRLGPTSVLAHELGHQIDHKYGLQAVMKEEKYDAQRKREVQQELKDLADKRFEGREVSKNFKSYVRKNSEKMAVMFEAYVANREMFKEVAPHLYDDFRDFLASHEELRPFLDIQPSVSLGSEQHGGEHVAGIAGKEFIDDAGNSYVVGQATTKEIEANTATRYYKDPLANYALAIERTARAVRANELLNKIKESPMYKDTIKKADGSDGDIPLDFKSTRLDQFRNYRMEPHLAEAFDDLAKRSQGGLYIPVYDEINNLLITALVINPIMHYPNVAVGWGAATAAAGVVPELDFMRTFKQVIDKDPEYLKWVQAGAPFQYLRQTNAEFADAMLSDIVQNANIDPTRYEELAKMLGYANPIEWAKGLEKISADSTWVANDVMLFNALKTYQKANNATFEESIAQVTKRLADYRVPPRVLGSRALSMAMQNNAIFVFTRFHYSGVIKPWVTSLADTVDPRSEEKGGPSSKERLAGIRTLAYFALMYFVYQLADKGLQNLTGDSNTYMSMAGPMRLVQNIQKSFEAESPQDLISSTFSFTPAVNIVGSMITGYDFSNFFKPVYGPGGEGMWSMLGNQAAIYQGVEGAFNGTGSWTNYALNMGGVYSPKTTTQTSTLNSMLNVEKPQVEAQMKADIASGDTASATALAKDFNDRLKSAIVSSLQSVGKSGDAAQVQYYLSTFPNGLGQKGYAIRMPSATTMKNYEAKVGLSSTQKVFGASVGNGTGQGIPSSSTNTTNPGSVEKVTPNGVTIYNRMSNESQVKAELSGGKIEPNTQLDHIVPLEGGGTNEVTNIQIIPQATDDANNAVENFIGQEVQAGRMDLAQATEIAIRYKAGLGQPLTPALQEQYKNDYGAQPLTLSQIYNYAQTVPAK